MMAKFLFLLALAMIAGLPLRAENRLVNGSFASGDQSGWKTEFRPAGSGTATVEEGKLQIERSPESTFARVYQDVKLKSGRHYLLTFRHRAYRGALDKLLVIFRTRKGEWLESGRLSYIAPLLSGEWSAGRLIFKVPEEVDSARIDLRIDYPGVIDLTGFGLRLATAAEIAEAALPHESAAWQPEESNWRQLASGELIRDFEVQPDCNYCFAAEMTSAGENGKLFLIFRDQVGDWIPNSRLTLFPRSSAGPTTLREIFLVPEMAVGIRLVTTPGTKAAAIDLNQILERL